VKLVAWCSALLVLVGVAVGLGEVDDDGRPAPAPAGGSPRAEVELAGLRSFDGCGELLAYLRETARTAGVGGATPGALGQRAVAEDSAGGAEVATAASAAGAAPVGDDDGFSGTNLQERDVDEPDLVKTDGEVIVAVAAGNLHLLAPGPGGPRRLATLDLPEGSSEVLLSGDRVLVLTRSWREVAAGGDDGAEERRFVDLVAGEPVTVLTAVDVADPGAPRVVESRSLDGDYLSARVVGTTARLVLRAQPDLGQPEPQLYQGRDAAEDVERWYEEAIAAAPLETWLPSDGERPLVACDAVTRPADPAGVGTLTVLTLDVAGSLEPRDATAVVADAETVYASSDRLYVATTSWHGCCGRGGITDDAPVASTGAGPAATTELHAFDTSGATTPYLGSGRVAGRLLNSWALSEHEGTLRVATTIEAADGGSASESAVVTLAERDGALVEQGRLTGLGTTEQIYAVRYAGDVAYVVTFRQTDPLYTIDLSDPAAPRLLGELKVPGYAAYLHPTDPGRLVGVGQDATDEGRTQGTQVSSFDVSDLAAPTQVDRVSFPDSSSPVEYDHRAFLWWGADRVAVVPIETYTFTTGPLERGGGVAFLGAVAVDVGPDGRLAERGRVTHQGKAAADAYPAISRSLVVGATLYTLSDVGLLASDLETLAEVGWAAF
jgi:hypothetical protein